MITSMKKQITIIYTTERQEIRRKSKGSVRNEGRGTK